VVFFAGCAAHPRKKSQLTSQQQQEEDARIDRILKPDTTRANPMQGKSFYGGKNFGDSRTANTRSFYSTGKVETRSAPTRDLPGVTSFWASGKKAESKTAQTKNWGWLSPFGHPFGSKKMETRENWDAEKKFTSNSITETSEYRGPERKKINQTIPNTDKELSIGDVRELLNKNK